jgi:hypothetical protein
MAEANMQDNSCIPPRFKIDKSTDGWWRFAVYERMSCLGIKYWARVYRTDELDAAIEYVRELQKVPLYLR